MRVQLYSFFIILFHYSHEERDCSRPQYYWRRYFGVIPHDAFIAGVNCNNENIYVGVVALHKNGLWYTPIQLEKGQEYVPFRWTMEDHLQTTNEFLHILCVTVQCHIEWARVRKYPQEIMHRCCLIEAGVGKESSPNKRIYYSLVGRKKVNAVFYVGRVSMLEPSEGVQYMAELDPVQSKYEYDVLAYNCDPY